MNAPYGLPCVDNCLTCNLRTDSFFCALSRETLSAFNDIKQAAVYPERSVVFVEGQSPRGIFMLCQGQAKLSTISREGRIFILRIAKPGEVLGLHAAITGRPYELTGETMQPCQLNFVAREDFIVFLKKHGDACMRAAQHISRDYQDACNVVRSVGSHSTSERLARFLLDTSIQGHDTDGVIRSKLTLTHEDISHVIGTSRETITRALAEFRKLGILELKGSTLIIRNKAALDRLGAA